MFAGGREAVSTVADVEHWDVGARGVDRSEGPEESEGVVGRVRARHQRHRTAAEPRCRLDHTQARGTTEMHADVAVCCKLLTIEITDYTLTKFGLVEYLGFKFEGKR